MADQNYATVLGNLQQLPQHQLALVAELITDLTNKMEPKDALEKAKRSVETTVKEGQTSGERLANEMARTGGHASQQPGSPADVNVSARPEDKNKR